MCILYDFICVSMFNTSFPKLKLQLMHIVDFKIIKGCHDSVPIPASLTRNNFSEVNSVCFVCIQHIYGSFSILLTNGSIPHIIVLLALFPLIHMFKSLSISAEVNQPHSFHKCTIFNQNCVSWLVQSVLPRWALRNSKEDCMSFLIPAALCTWANISLR